MFKLLKHEFKGRYKNFLIMVVGLFLVDLLIMQELNGLTEIKDIMIWTALFGILNVGAAAMIIVDGFRLLNRDFSTETGYLIFTLPLRAHSILLSKMLLTILELAVILSEVKFMTVMTLGKPLGSISQNLIILGAVLTVYVGFLILVYFAQSVGKMSINNMGYGKLITAVVIIGVTYAVVYIDQYLSEAFPSSFLITSLKESRYEAHMIQANTASLIFEVCLAVVLFITTAWLIEKKVDI